MLPTLYSYWGIGENLTKKFKKQNKKKKQKKKKKQDTKNVRTLYLQSFG